MYLGVSAFKWDVLWPYWLRICTVKKGMNVKNVFIFFKITLQLKAIKNIEPHYIQALSIYIFKR